MTGIVVVQHHEVTGPAAFAPELDAVAAGWRLVDVPSGGALPAVGSIAGAVVLGGTMSAVDPAAHPWMPAELAWLRDAIAADVPVLGVCLGAQLLGSALGGTVTRRARPEVGFPPLARTAAGRDDPTLGGWTDGAPAVLIHEDEVTGLPPGARPLLSGSEGSPAWRAGSALAVQFHPEVDAEVLAGWAALDGLAGLLAAAGWSPERLVRAGAAHEAATLEAGRGLLRRWVAHEVRGAR